MKAITSDFDEEYYLETNPDVAVALRSGVILSGWEHFVRYGREEGRRGVPLDGEQSHSVTTRHREEAAARLRGEGLEIGPLHLPFPVPSECKVTYCDRLPVEGLQVAYPELSRARLHPLDFCTDLNTDGLGSVPEKSRDFVIFSSGIQQVANPIAVVEELFRVTRAGGHVVISIPDKQYTAEATRPLTPWEHLLDEYLHGVTVVTDAHYVDLLFVYAPKLLYEGVVTIEPRLKEFRRRSEHAHVWDSTSFRDFMQRALRVCDVKAELSFEATGEQTGREYLAVFEKHAD